jgi:hypothetical protein
MDYYWRGSRVTVSGGRGRYRTVVYGDALAWKRGIAKEAVVRRPEIVGAFGADVDRVPEVELAGRLALASFSCVHPLDVGKLDVVPEVSSSFLKPFRKGDL